MLQSWFVLIYVAIGGVWWERCVRPAEEADLTARFGDAYRGYRSRVRIWIPGVRGGAQQHAPPQPGDSLSTDRR